MKKILFLSLLLVSTFSYGACFEKTKHFEQTSLTSDFDSRPGEEIVYTDINGLVFFNPISNNCQHVKIDLKSLDTWVIYTEEKFDTALIDSSGDISGSKATPLEFTSVSLCANEIGCMLITNLNNKYTELYAH